MFIEIQLDIVQQYCLEGPDSCPLIKFLDSKKDVLGLSMHKPEVKNKELFLLRQYNLRPANNIVTRFIKTYKFMKIYNQANAICKQCREKQRAN